MSRPPLPFGIGGCQSKNPSAKPRLEIQYQLMENDLAQEVAKRRTFAIISHPDAGKTTLTEKLLLYSGKIRTAGMVRGKKGRKAASSDWMSLEQERGISITSSTLQFTYKGTTINILDTPGHEDFSEDTYRTLTAADCAIMVLDAAKGVEKQTRKLFEVCRFRKIPVLTFINKMDMPARDPLDLMDELEQVLGIDSHAYNWPIGSGKLFSGVYDRIDNRCLLFSRSEKGSAYRAEMKAVAFEEAEQLEAGEHLRDEIELLEAAGNAFDKASFLKGEVTPVFFGSALSNYGVEPFFDAFITLAPPPSGHTVQDDTGKEISIDPVTSPFSAFVFKVQSNMDPKHRDSSAFLRICSGQFDKDMTVRHHRLKRSIRLARPQSMLAGERSTIDTACAGDIVGVINPGVFAIGDTVSLNGGFSFPPLPQFQPEVFAKITPKDVSKRKAFDKGIQQLAAEGTVQLLYKDDGFGEVLYGAVGKLQFEVMQYRLKDEYRVDTEISPLPFSCSAWVKGDASTYKKPFHSIVVKDGRGKTMALFSSQWEKNHAIRENPKLEFSELST